METKLKDYIDKLTAIESRVCRVQWNAHAHITNLMVQDELEGWKVAPVLQRKAANPLIRYETRWSSPLRGSVLRFVRRVRRAANA